MNTGDLSYLWRRAGWESRDVLYSCRMASDDAAEEAQWDALARRRKLKTLLAAIDGGPSSLRNAAPQPYRMRRPPA